MIAAEAARIMVTQAQPNYRIAKQKAAQRLGAGAHTVLPSNVEVETALRAYQEFYGGAQHVERLQKLRECALRVMRSLESFHPRLVGPVLDGTADRHSRISLHVFNDPPDAVAVHLLDRGLAFGHEQRKIRWHDGSHRQVALLITQMENTEVELNLFNSLDLRQAPPSPVDGRPQKRAPISEVECLLSASA
jgi:predicted nucleotidyltransferase